jgi:hypothetical protein
MTVFSEFFFGKVSCAKANEIINVNAKDKNNFMIKAILKLPVSNLMNVTKMPLNKLLRCGKYQTLLSVFYHFNGLKTNAMRNFIRRIKIYNLLVAYKIWFVKNFLQKTPLTKLVECHVA